MAGFVGGPLSSIYAASKHAMEGFSDSLRSEVSHFNISVSIVEPAYVSSEIFGKSAAIAEENLKDNSVAANIKALYPALYSPKATAKRAKGNEVYIKFF